LPAAEGMILLSRLIKSQWAAPKTEKRIIGIKAVQSNNTGSYELPYVFEEQGESIIGSAQMQADMIMQEAAVHAQAVREQIASEKEEWERQRHNLEEAAQRKGYEQGLGEGRNQGYQEYSDTITFAKEIVEDSKLEYKKNVEKAERTILELGMKVAGRILGTRISEQEEDFLLIVKRALKEAREFREVQVHVNPSRYSFLLSRKDELIALFPREVDFYIYPDEDLLEEACLIESANGRIDASVDSQLDEIKNKLIDLLESGTE